MVNPQKMIDAIEQAMLESAGVKQVSVDGQVTVFTDREAMLAELQYWQTKLAAQQPKAKRRPLSRGFDLNVGW